MIDPRIPNRIREEAEDRLKAVRERHAAEIAKARKVIDLLLVAAKPHLKRTKGEPRPGQTILEAAIRQADDYLKETEEVTG
jgi:ElaB/YqjD/DUF883 family membrane-anchored ribosome-binding protein